MWRITIEDHRSLIIGYFKGIYSMLTSLPIHISMGMSDIEILYMGMSDIEILYMEICIGRLYGKLT